MVIKKQPKYLVSNLYKTAEEYYQTNIEEETIIKNNVTELFYYELKQSILSGERLFIEVHGPTRSAKSTISIQLGKNIYDIMKKAPLYNIKTNFGMKNIARDQSERIKRLMDPNTNHTVIVTDEDNELEKTGENSSSQEALQKTISDIHAGRYVHEIMISPRDSLDPNTQIILNTIPGGINKEEKTVFCKLYYRFWEGTLDHTQLVGHIEIYVGELINKWEGEAKELHFMNKPQLKYYKDSDDRLYITDCKTYTKAKEKLNKICEKDFYTNYQVKKYEKMDMLTKEGIFRPRMLEISQVILNVYERLKQLSKNKTMGKELVRNFVKMEMRKAKIVNSIVGERLATDEVWGILMTNQSIAILQQEKNKDLQNRHLYLENISVLEEALSLQLDELHTYKRIHEQYSEEEDGGNQ